MNGINNNTSVLRQLAALKNLNLEQLREKWKSLYGTEAPGYKKQFLFKRLSYRIQELFYGGLSEQSRSYLKNIAQSDPAATVKCKISQVKKSSDIILPGTRFVRIWKEERHEVITHEDGFEYKGRIFRSLSAIAREITGTRWNGKIFFGVRDNYSKKQ